MSVYLNQARSLSYIDIGFIFLIGGLMSVPISSVGGNLMDRFGRRKFETILPWILFSISIVMFILVYFDIYTLILVSLFIVEEPLLALQWVTMNTIVSDVTEDIERISGYSKLRIASNAGIGIGLVLGGLLATVNYSYIFILSIIGFSAEGIIYYFHIPETAKNINLKFEHIKLKNTGIKIPLHDIPFVIVSTIIAFGWFFTGMFESPLTPLYMSSINHFSLFKITLLFAINAFIVIVFQNTVNKIFINTKDHVRIILGLILFSLGYIIFAEFAFYSTVVIGVIILTFGENISAPASIALISKMAPEETRGTYMGFNSSIQSLINPFRPFVATILLAATVSRPYISWLILGFISFFIALIFILIFNVIFKIRIKKGSE